MTALRTGFALGMSLIMALGPQNLYVIQQGIKKQRVFLATLICILCDCFLITMSGSSVSLLLLKYPRINVLLIIAGSLFLLYYGGTSFSSAYQRINKNVDIKNNSDTVSLSTIAVIAASCSFSLFNPQAILDLFLIVGGQIAQLPSDLRFQFMGGVMLSSCLWFILLMLLSIFFSTLLNKSKVWIMFDVISGSLMWYFSLRLLTQLTLSHFI